MTLDHLSKPPPNQPGLRAYWASLDPNVKASIWADYRQGAKAIDASNSENRSLTAEESELELDVGKVIKEIKEKEVRNGKQARVGSEVELAGSGAEESDDDSSSETRNNTDSGSGEYIFLDLNKDETLNFNAYSR